MKKLWFALSLLALVAIVWGPSVLLQADVVRSGAPATVGGGGGGMPTTGGTFTGDITMAAGTWVNVAHQRGISSGSTGNLHLRYQATGSGIVENGSSQTIQQWQDSIVRVRPGNSDRIVFNGAVKTLTDAVATTFARIDLAADTNTGVIVQYQIDAENATDQQSIIGQAHIAITNDVGVEACSVVTEVGEVSGVTVGTITATITCDTTPTNGVNLQMTSDSSLNVSPRLDWTIQRLGGYQTGTTVVVQ